MQSVTERREEFEFEETIKKILLQNKDEIKEKAVEIYTFFVCFIG